MNQGNIMGCRKCQVGLNLIYLKSENIALMCIKCGDIHSNMPAKDFIELWEKHTSPEKRSMVIEINGLIT